MYEQKYYISGCSQPKPKLESTVNHMICVVVGLGFMEAPESSAISVCQPYMKLKPSNVFRQ
jgi:hypothetical protein